MSPTVSLQRPPTARIAVSGGVTNRIEPTYKKVHLRVHSVSCVKTTKEIDKDEITVAALKTVGVVSEKQGRRMVKAKGKAGKSVNAGKFKKGTVQKFRSPKVLATFSYGGSKRDWPRHYPATLILIERDRGSVSAVVNAAIKAIDDKAVVLVKGVATGLATAVAGGAAAGSVVPIVGTAVGAAAAAAAAVGLNAIKAGRAHDVIGSERVDFNPKKAPTKPGMVGSRKTKTFVGQKGKYKVSYSWEVR